MKENDIQPARFTDLSPRTRAKFFKDGHAPWQSEQCWAFPGGDAVLITREKRAQPKWIATIRIGRKVRTIETPSILKGLQTLGVEVQENVK
jgi:hypothetical protein